VFRDVLGVLQAIDAHAVVIRTRRGADMTVPVAEIVLARRVPDIPARRTRGGRDTDGRHRIDDLELERIAALGWPGIESATLGGWTLRAGRGFTGRANSVLTLGESGTDLDTALGVVRDWYAERGLPAVAQVPLPARAELAAALLERGWRPGNGAVVLTARVADVVAACPPVPNVGPHQSDPTPDGGWLSLYRYRGGDLPPGAIDVLLAGPAPRFVSLVLHGTTAAVCRTVIAEGWLGVTAVEVALAHRRQGLARHLMGVVAADAAAGGASDVYVQTEPSNTPALELYAGIGFTPHHEYRYLRAPD